MHTHSYTHTRFTFTAHTGYRHSKKEGANGQDQGFRRLSDIFQSTAYTLRNLSVLVIQFQLANRIEVYIIIITHLIT